MSSTGPEKPSYPDEPLAIIEQESRAMAICFGAAAPTEAAGSFHRSDTGSARRRVDLFAQTQHKSKQRVRAELMRKFNGRDLFELSLEYRMIPRKVRRIPARTESKN